MITQIVEATNKDQNWGKFLVGKFDQKEWSTASAITREYAPASTTPILYARGWADHHRFVMDIETGEGLMVAPGGSAYHDLQKHSIWCCPMFEPFLAWWYTKWPEIDVGTFPEIVQLDDAEFAMYGYRRPGPLGRKYADVVFTAHDLTEEDQEKIAGLLAP